MPTFDALTYKRLPALVVDVILPVTNVYGAVRVPVIDPETTGVTKVGEDKVEPAMLDVVREPVIEASPTT